jgi:hypothetical protein
MTTWAGQGYLFSQIISKMLAILSEDLLGISTILNHPVAGSLSLSNNVIGFVFAFANFVGANKVNTDGFPRRDFSLFGRQVS